MLEKNMLVDDGWRPYQRGSIGRTAAREVRVSKGGSRLILTRLMWEALGSPALVNVLWDPARVRVALEPATADDVDALAVSEIGHASTRVVAFAVLSSALGLAVEKATTVPHELVGFRLIVDLRALRMKDGAA